MDHLLDMSDYVLAFMTLTLCDAGLAHGYLLVVMLLVLLLWMLVCVYFGPELCSNSPPLDPVEVLL